MATVIGLREYCREDKSADKELKLFLSASIGYITGAGVSIQKHEAYIPLYDMTVYMLAAHWWDNRGIAIDKNLTGEIPISVTALLIQLRELCDG